MTLPPLLHLVWKVLLFIFSLHECVDSCRGWKMVSELELRVVLNHPTWVLETNLVASGEMVYLHWASSPEALIFILHLLVFWESTLMPLHTCGGHRTDWGGGLFLDFCHVCSWDWIQIVRLGDRCPHLAVILLARKLVVFKMIFILCVYVCFCVCMHLCACVCWRRPEERSDTLKLELQAVPSPLSWVLG